MQVQTGGLVNPVCGLLILPKAQGHITCRTVRHTAIRDDVTAGQSVKPQVQYPGDASVMRRETAFIAQYVVCYWTASPVHAMRFMDSNHVCLLCLWCLLRLLLLLLLLCVCVCVQEGQPV